MAKRATSSLGEWLVAIGCVWFVLAFFWWPPAVILFSWFPFPAVFFQMLLPAEFLISAAMVASGILLRRRSIKKLALADYIIVFVGVSIPILAVFNLYGWVHLPRR